jgi:hypothetical protein
MAAPAALSPPGSDRMEKFTFVGLLVRLLLALALVLVTFNPTGHSFLHWLADGFPAVTPLKVVAGQATVDEVEEP